MCLWSTVHERRRRGRTFVFALFLILFMRHDDEGNENVCTRDGEITFLISRARIHIRYDRIFLEHMNQKVIA
jgi:hypothetical protein